MHIKKGDMFLFIIICSLSLGFLIMLGNIQEREYGKILQNGFCTDFAIKFNVDKFPEKYFDLSVKDNVEIIHNFSASEFEVKGIFASKWYKKPIISDGRFFTQAESRSKKKIAVIGKDLTSKCIKKNYKSYITIEKNEYEVIGVVAEISGKRLNNTVFVPMYSSAVLKNVSGVYLLDGKDEKTVNLKKQDFIDCRNNYGCSWQKSIKQNKTVFGSDSEKIILVVYTIVICSIILTGISSIKYWFCFRKKEINTRTIIGGYSYENLIWLVSLFIRRLVPAIIVANLIYFLLNYIRGKFIYNIKLILVVDIVIVLCSILTIVIIYVINGSNIFRKDNNMTVHMLYLCIEFSILFWVMIQGISYYINLEDDSVIKTCKGNYSYYTMFLSGSDSSMSKQTEVESESGYYQNAKNALKSIRKIKDFSYMAYSKDWVIRMKASDVKKAFGKDSYDNFLRGSLYPGYYNKQNMYMKPKIEKLDGISQISMSFCSVDFNAVRHYHLKTDSGRNFNADDFREQKPEDEIPLILGNAYKKYFNVGQKIKCYIYGRESKCKIIGFYKKNTAIVTDLTNEQTGFPMLLDYDIVFPYRVYKNEPKNENLKNFVLENITRQLLGIVAVSNKKDSKTDVQIEKKVNEIYMDNNLFTVTPMSAPAGVELFQSETNSSMNTLSFIIAASMIFDVIMLILNMLNMIRNKKYEHAIKLLNGCSYYVLLKEYILQITATICTSIIIQVILEKNYLFANKSYLLLMIIISAAVIAVTTVFMAIEIYTINIENSVKAL